MAGKVDAEGFNLSGCGAGQVLNSTYCLLVWGLVALTWVSGVLCEAHETPLKPYSIPI